MAEESRVGQLLSQPNPLHGLRTSAAPFIDENLSEAAIMQLLSQLLKTAPATEPTLGGVAEKMAIGLGGFVDPRMVGAATLREGLDRTQEPMAPEDMAQSGMLPLGGITLYHGTQKRFLEELGKAFGRFRDDMLGTGVGMQRFGRGHYLSDDVNEAMAYTNANSRPSIIFDGKRFFREDLNKEDSPQSNALQALLLSNGDSLDETVKYYQEVAKEQNKWGKEARETLAWLANNRDRIEFDSPQLYVAEFPDERVGSLLHLDKKPSPGDRKNMVELLMEELKAAPKESAVDPRLLSNLIARPDTRFRDFLPEVDYRAPRVGDALMKYLGAPGSKFEVRRGSDKVTNYVIRRGDDLNIVERMPVNAPSL